MSASVLGGFIDSLVQKLENCRAALPESLEPAAIERYVSELYEAERPRLHEAVQALAPLVEQAQLEKEEEELDALLRRVLLPAYGRTATLMTRRERNDFYLARAGLHGLERVGWLAGGVLAGTLVVWAPFIPIWSKEAILPFALGGLFFPELRRFFAYRRYARELNGLVGKIEIEVQRLQAVYLEAPTVMERLESSSADASSSSSEAPSSPEDQRKLPSGQTEGH